MSEEMALKQIFRSAVADARHRDHRAENAAECPKYIDRELAELWNVWGDVLRHAAPLIRVDERQATADEIAAALDDEAERAGGPIFTRALEHAAEIARRVGGGGGGGQ